ncbi:ATP-binding protein [Escherichia coli]
MRFWKVSTLSNAECIDAVSRALQHDLSDVIGQEQGKRGLEITAAGGHNLLLIGLLGTGKTMLASRINGLLPDLSNEEALESAAILSLVNAESVQKQWRQRPFRSPHHSASLTAMVGGGAIPGPGEISLAHNGVLFLDELPELNGVHWMPCESRSESGRSIFHAHEQK